MLWAGILIVVFLEMFLPVFSALVLTIKLPNPVKVKESVDTNSVYSSLEIGYDKGGDYEEAFGLDEYNGISKFTTIITRVKNIFIRRSN